MQPGRIKLPAHAAPPRRRACTWLRLSLGAACQSSRAVPVPTSAPSNAAQRVAIDAPPPASPPANRDAAPMRAMPYPDAFIATARSDNSKLACNNLIYAQGCTRTRTGTVAYAITLAPDGTVASATLISNTIRNDPKLVAACLVRQLPRWKFTPPGDHAAELTLTLRFADMC